MLDAFIIEEIKRRERGREDRPALELPIPTPPPAHSEPGKPDEPEKPGDGVVIIDYTA